MCFASRGYPRCCWSSIVCDLDISRTCGTTLSQSCIWNSVLPARAMLWFTFRYFPLQIVMMFLVIPQCLVLIVLAIESHSLHQTFLLFFNHSEPATSIRYGGQHTSPSPLSSCIRVVRLLRSNGITIAYAAGGLCRRKLRCQKKLLYIYICI